MQDEERTRTKHQEQIGMSMTPEQTNEQAEIATPFELTLYRMESLLAMMLLYDEALKNPSDLDTRLLLFASNHPPAEA